jgi:hypothetical protein
MRLPRVLLVISSYTVVRQAGEEYSFDINSLRRIKAFGRMLRERASQFQWPWETSEVRA